MKEKPVSIIIPIYNAEKYLPECMESILQQTYQNIEIICVDDGSTDGSAEIIREFQRKDERITLIRQENQYAGVARNHGFDASKGEYVMFLDADDYFDRTLIEKMAYAAYEKDADIVICDSLGVDEKTQLPHELIGAHLNCGILPEKDVFSKKDIPEHIFQLTAGWAWDKMYRATFLRKKNIRFQNTRVANDALFVDIAYAEAGAITVVKEVLVTHRTNITGSLVNTGDPYWQCYYDMLEEEITELKNRGLYKTLERSFLNWAAGYIYYKAGTFTNTAFFSAFYAYFQKEAVKEFGFLDHPAEFYYDSFMLEMLQKMKQCGEVGFLLEHNQRLNHIVSEQHNHILHQEEHIKGQAEHIKGQDEHIKGQDEHIGSLKGLCKSKHWRFYEELFPEGASILVYGYGDVGKDFVYQILHSKRLTLYGGGGSPIR